jgi:thiamine biosynthesis lipoprotein
MIAGIAIAVGVWVFLDRATRPSPPLTGTAMGSRWTLSWRGDAPRGLDREVAAVLEHWEQVMSQWRDDSDLSRHNRGQPATEDLARVLRRAEAMREATGGAFDPRVLALVHKAGHGPPGDGLDLSAIGKGFAADRVGDRLRELGIEDFLFEIGGDLLAGGGGWTIGIESPVPGNHRIVRTRKLENRAMATSGNTYRPTHIIDPRTGASVIRPPSTVTVIAADGATADAWATALFVLGPGHDGTPPDIEVTWQMADPP